MRHYRAGADRQGAAVHHPPGGRDRFRARRGSATAACIPATFSSPPTRLAPRDSASSSARACRHPRAGAPSNGAGAHRRRSVGNAGRRVFARGDHVRAADGPPPGRHRRADWRAAGEERAPRCTRSSRAPWTTIRRVVTRPPSRSSASSSLPHVPQSLCPRSLCPQFLSPSSPSVLKSWSPRS